MANEITVIDEGDVTNGKRLLNLLLIYPIDTPHEVVTGVNVVVTPSEGLPELVTAAVTQTEKDDLDSGDAAFEVINFRAPSGMTNPQILAKAQTVYATRKAAFEAKYTARFSRTGQRFDVAV